MWSSTPSKNLFAKPATGFSPTTCRRKPASWAATATPSISSPRTMSSIGRLSRRTKSPVLSFKELRQRWLNENEIHQDQNRPAAARRRSAVAGLPERGRRRPRSHGRGAGGGASRDRAGRTGADSDRHFDRATARDGRPGAAAIRSGGAPRHLGVEHAGHDRFRLPGRNTGYSCEFRRRIVFG